MAQYGANADFQKNYCKQWRSQVIGRVANVKINLRILNNLYNAHEELTDA